MTNGDKRKFKQQSFVNWYNTISWTQYQITKQQLCDVLGVSRQTIENYYKGITEIPDMAIAGINKIAGKNIFDNGSGL